jgi:uncharacterized protein (DUF924 family)
MTEIGPRDVLDFWFKETPPAKWFASDPSFDAEIRSRFEAAWRSGCAGGLAHWEDELNGQLALILLFDQFPRNMFRGTARAFAADPLALEAARHAVDQGFDRTLAPVERLFVYLPFEHSERLEDQLSACELMEPLQAFPETADIYRYAQAHRDIVQRFGRFPHRNAALGRASTPEELEFLKQPGSGF